ncbi:hypothetical protein RJ639_001273, partial [Escallonia herrerae]
LFLPLIDRIAVAGCERGVSAHTLYPEHERGWETEDHVRPLTSIKGIGRRYANIVCKKADVNMNKRFDEINSELEEIIT